MHKKKYIWRVRFYQRSTGAIIRTDRQSIELAIREARKAQRDSPFTFGDGPVRSVKYIGYLDN